MSDSFVHLHVHNEYSMLDGAAQIEPTMKHVAEVLHQPAIASTNHGFLFDTYEFMSAAKNHGVKPIVGLEAYIAPESRFTRSKMPFKGVEGTEDNYSHMTMLAENNEGLHNLFRLSTLASYEGFYHKPRMDRELLSQYASGLIATTGCLGGEVNQLLLRGKRAEALEAAGEFRDIFGADNFFFEVMDHGIPEERAIRQDQLAIAEKLGLPLLATNDSHYLHADQKDSHQALLCVQSGSTLEDPKMVFSGEGYHIKSSEEMRTLWRDYKSACDNTLLVAERCDVSLDPRDDLFPDFPVPPGYTFGDYLSEQTWKGLRERVGSISPELEARTKYELEIILDKNYAGYFLVVSDFIRWAKSQGIMIGPGRGSGGGSVVAYGMRITDLYPLDHGLLFERFLNPERPSAPDFDIDIQDDRRQEVIDYVTKKYGAERVAMIVTYGTIKGKQAIKDSTKVLGLPISTGETLSKAYPEAIMGKEASMASVLDKGVNSARYREGAKLRELAESDPNNARVLEVARGLEGLKRQWGVHAAGVVVSSHELMDVIPLMKRPSDGTIVTQFDYPTCESLGLLKMDFLGLRNLTVLSKARDNLKKTTGQDIEYTDLPLDDKKTYELLSRGETMGVFQMDGNDMRKLMRRMRPTQFENIVAVGALYRPGPMGAGSHLKYADRKNGREAVDYIHPELKEILEPILGTTFGLCVPAGTPIFDSVAGKWVPIEELQAGHSKTPSLNEATGTLETKTVNHVVHTGEKKIVKITLNGGRELRVSRTHPVLTDRGYVEAGDLAVNDRVRMGNEASAPVSPHNGSFSTDRAYFLGAMLGDGTMTDSNQQYLTNSEQELLDEMARIAEGEFENVFTSTLERSRDGEAYTNLLTFHSGEKESMSSGKVAPASSIRAWFREVGYPTAMAASEKYISDAVFASDNEVLANLVAGLWDTDGTTQSGLHFTTISESLWEGMQKALLRLGVDFGVSKSPYSNPTREDQVAYRVFPVHADFAEKVLPYLRSTRKREGARTFTGVARNGVERHLALAEEVFTVWLSKNLDEDLATVRMLNAVQNGTKIGWKSARTYLNRAFGTTLKSKTDFINALAQLRIGDIQYSATLSARYRTILSVASDGVADCYDIEVADNHNFLVNGVVVHNCVYQEQVMEMGQVLADYSLGEADLLRRAMGKKKKDVVDQAKPHFMNKMKEKGFSEEAFQAVWDVIVPFSDYAFNRSHAAAYGLISYWTAYMKSHYPTEYMSALLSLSVENPVTLGVYLAETRRMGIEILPPNVNVSDYDYTPHNGSIVFGLGGIKGVSSASSEKILRDRSEEGYASLSDFFYTTGSNAAVGKALINAGAFDSFGITRAGLEAQLPNIAKMSAVRRKDEANGVYDLLSTLDVSEDGKNFRPAYDPEFPSVEWDREEVISREYEATKMYLTGHPLEGRTKALEMESTVSWFDALNVLGNREQITIGGLLKDVNIRLSKRNNLWGEMNLVGVDGTLAMRCFKGDLLESKRDAFQENNIVAVRATVVNEDDSYFLQVNNIKVVTETDDDVVIPDPIVIQADKSQMTRDAVEKLQYCAKQYRGVTPVTMRVKGTNQHLTLPYHMKSDDALKRALMAIFGNDCIVSGF